MSKKKSKKGRGGIDNGCLDPAGISQPDIKENVLEGGLDQPQTDHPAPFIAAWHNNFLIIKAGDKPGNNPRQAKTIAGKQNLGTGCIDIKKDIADFYGRIGTTPEQAAKGCQGQNKALILQSIFQFFLLILLLPVDIKKTATCAADSIDLNGIIQLIVILSVF